MISRLRREHLRAYVILLSILLFVVFILYHQEKRDHFYSEYIKHKEVMFMLANSKNIKKAEINEEFINRTLSNFGARLRSLKQVTEGYEVKGAELSGAKLPELIYFLEDSGFEILSFKALDNTGSGIYDFEMSLR